MTVTNVQVVRSFCFHIHWHCCHTVHQHNVTCCCVDEVRWCLHVFRQTCEYLVVIIDLITRTQLWQDFRVLFADVVRNSTAFVGEVGEVTFHRRRTYTKVQRQFVIHQADGVLCKHLVACGNGFPVTGLVWCAIRTQNAASFQPDVVWFAVGINGDHRTKLFVGCTLVPETNQNLVVVELMCQGCCHTRTVSTCNACIRNDHFIQSVAVAVQIHAGSVFAGSFVQECAFRNQFLLNAAVTVAIPVVRNNFQIGAVTKTCFDDGGCDHVLKRILCQFVEGVSICLARIIVRFTFSRCYVTDKSLGVIVVVTVFVQISQIECTDVLVDCTVVQDGTGNRVETVEVGTEAHIYVITACTTRAFPFVRLCVGIGNEETGFVIKYHTCVVTQVSFFQVQTTQSLHHAEAFFFRRIASGDTEVTAGCTDLRGVNVGRTLSHELCTGVFLIHELLWVHSEATGVIDRYAVDRCTDLVAVKAAQCQAATEQAGCIVVVAVNRRHQFQRFIGIACRTLFCQFFRSNRAACFWRVFLHHQTHTDFFTGDGDLFGIDWLIVFLICVSRGHTQTSDLACNRYHRQTERHCRCFLEVHECS